MYFSATVGGASHLWRQRFPDGIAEPIKIGSTSDELGIAVTADGRSLVTAIGRRQSSLWMHDAAGDRLLSPEGAASLPKMSHDGKRVYFLLRRTATSPVELSVLEIASGKVDRVVADREASDFDISPDEQTAAFTTRPDGKTPEVWVAPIDRASAPRLVAKSADRVNFGPGQDVVVRALEGRLNFIDRVSLRDGTRTRVSNVPVLNTYVVSPDRLWLVVMRPAQGETAAERLEAVPVTGGEPKLLSTSPGNVTWSADGRWVYASNSANRMTAIELRNGQIFPAFPADGTEPLAAWVKQPGGRAVEQSTIAAVSDPAVYVFQKISEMRNLFRIPAPAAR